MSFAHPWLLALVALIPAGLALWFLGARRGTRAQRLVSRERPTRPGYLAAALFSLAAVAAIVAAAQPRWGEHQSLIPRSGAQMIVVLDVSRSMGAQDVQPSRFEAAKSALLTAFRRLGGDRVGLVIFGGDARIRFPLTTDLNAAAQVVSSLEPGVVLVDGGTSASSGLDIAVGAFDPSADAGRLIVLITDGDDLGADPAGAARRIDAAGIDLVVAGAGTLEGAPVPVYDAAARAIVNKLDDAGQPIITRLNEPFLRTLAAASGGTYAGSDLRALPGVIEGRISALKRAQFEQEAASFPVERYQWFAGAALLLVVLASVARWAPAPGRRAGAVAAGLSALLLLGSCATRVHNLNDEGLAAFDAADFAAAAGRFIEAQQERPDDPRVSLNLAAALHAQGLYEEASTAARRALTSRDPVVRARAQASIGHHRFAQDDLEGALESFRRALVENPEDQASRHDYEVVWRLLHPDQPPEQAPSQQPTGSVTPTPAEGAEGPPASGSPGAGGTPGPTQEPGQQEEGEEAQQPGNGPTSPGDAERRIAAIDAQIQRLLEEAGEDQTAAEALEILELLAERERIAAIRDALAGGGDPLDY